MSKGFAAPVLLVILLIVSALGFYFYSQGKVSLPFLNKLPGVSQIASDEPQVELKTDYQNPFDEKAQYANPFSVYQNPFDYLD